MPAPTPARDTLLTREIHGCAAMTIALWRTHLEMRFLTDFGSPSSQAAYLAEPKCQPLLRGEEVGKAGIVLRMLAQSSQQVNGARHESENALWESVRSTDSEKIEECVGRGLPNLCQVLLNLVEYERQKIRKKAVSVTERQHQCSRRKQSFP